MEFTYLIIGCILLASLSGGILTAAGITVIDLVTKRNTAKRMEVEKW